MIRKSLALLLPFAVAMSIGLALGRRDSVETPTLATSLRDAPPDGPVREKRQPLDLQGLLRDFEAEQQAWIDGEVDPMADLLAEWTEEELQAALEEALTLPRCVARMGGDRRVPNELLEAWVKKSPDAVVAWIDGIRSSEMKEGMVRTALHNWPRDRAMEGIEFLLKHHWKPGKTYYAKILPGALEDKAREGAGEMIGLIERLAEAKVDIWVESLDLPADFDFAALVGSEGFRSHEKEGFQDRVMSEWRDRQPRKMLGWIEQAGEWERFNSFLDLERPAAFAAAASFWDEAEPELRESVLDSIQWRELDHVQIETFIRVTTDPEGQDRLIANGIAKGLSRYGKLDPVEMLELIPSAGRRLNILLQLHPYTDWRPDAEPASGEPPAAAAMRAAIGRWDIPVPPPAVEPDPFAD